MHHHSKLCQRVLENATEMFLLRFWNLPQDVLWRSTRRPVRFVFIHVFYGELNPRWHQYTVVPDVIQNCVGKNCTTIANPEEYSFMNHANIKDFTTVTLSVMLYFLSFLVWRLFENTKRHDSDVGTWAGSNERFVWESQWCKTQTIDYSELS